MYKRQDQNNEFPEEAIRKLGERGWMGLPYPDEYGGAGLDVMSYAIAVEELARVDGGAGVILSAHCLLYTSQSQAILSDSGLSVKLDSAQFTIRAQ